MPYPTETARVVVSGTLYDVEEFSFGVTLIPGDLRTGGSINEVPTEVRQSTSVLVQSVCGPAVALRTIKANRVDVNGRYQDQGQTTAYEYPAPGIRPSSGLNWPPQIALAVSLRTDNPRGLAGKGRFYLPCPAVGALSPAGQIPEADATRVAGFVVTWLNSLQAAFPTWQVGVASDVREGAIQPVTGVSVGRVLDTIRSRRAKMIESYHLPKAIAPRAGA